jgi:hypothetical protein
MNKMGNEWNKPKALFTLKINCTIGLNDLVVGDTSPITISFIEPRRTRRARRRSGDYGVR